MLEKSNRDKFENERYASALAIDRYSWIRDLAKLEQQLEESGMVDTSFAQDPERRLNVETNQFVHKVRELLVEYSTLFNEYKTSPIGRIKIYGIANTNCDFMLFRNGYKMVFSVKSPGVVSIRFNFLAPSGSQMVTASNLGAGASGSLEENILEAKVAAFESLRWFYQGTIVEILEVAKYHFSLFIRESAK